MDAASRPEGLARLRLVRAVQAHGESPDPVRAGGFFLCDVHKGDTGMELSFLVRGMVIGLAIAAPVGAIGLLCIRRTLADGRLVGFVSGLGAATADACYGAVAALGLTSLQAVLIAQEHWVRLIGGLFLCYLGVRTALAEPARNAARTRSGRGLAFAYGSTVALTLTNPSTILSFTAVFAGVGLGGAGADRTSAGLLVLGVFLGSTLWWLLLSSGVGLFGRALTRARMRWVNRVSGAALLALGLLALLGAMR
jgi:threonine/homoserine/homoserine lactone efflux protein